jgi:group I intron endonuclease
MSQEKKCGIYQIRNQVNGKKYIGQTIDLTNREEKWSNQLKNKDGRYNQHLEYSFAKYGSDNFDFSVLVDNCKESELDNLEIANILLHDTTDPDYGYNKTEGGEGGRPTNETRKKMSETKIRKIASGEIIIWDKGIKRPEMSIRQTGEGNPMFRKEPWNKGKKCPETSKRLKGKKRPEIAGDNFYMNKMTPEELEEHLKKRSEANTGENNPAAKLNNSNVWTIKRMVQLGYSVKYMADLFNVCENTIKRVKYGKSWTHIKGPSNSTIPDKFKVLLRTDSS